MRKWIVVAATALMPAVSSAQGALGPRSALYISGYQRSEVAVVQGLNVSTFGMISGAYVGAVNGEVKLWNAAGSPRSLTTSFTDRYALDGSYLGRVVSGGLGYTSFSDGATDGLRTYSVESADGYVISRGADWDAPSYPGIGNFFTTQRSSQGITYDPFSNTLWTTNCGRALASCNGEFYLTQFSMTGSVLNNFLVGGPLGWLAMDYTDGTFWTGGAGNTLYNLSTSGAVIGSVTYQQNITGQSGEFNLAVVPEPSTYALMATGLLVLGGFTRRRPRRVRS